MTSKVKKTKAKRLNLDWPVLAWQKQMLMRAQMRGENIASTKQFDKCVEGLLFLFDHIQDTEEARLIESYMRRGATRGEAENKAERAVFGDLSTPIDTEKLCVICEFKPRARGKGQTMCSICSRIETDK